MDGSDVVIRYQPQRFAGNVVVHCHRLVHEDEGMMAIERVRDGSNTSCICTSTSTTTATTTTTPGPTTLSLWLILSATMCLALAAPLMVFVVWKRNAGLVEYEKAEMGDMT
eukprot:CAMPEP_0118682520 /NCGR_PEP_ID=MMETSP0800-20121206/5528_1 /TAXON_ID=210618 ORGANISM="Striatella unipunctata, Strain CCMP2910" /NCGR_SAMPLE_ID=MMETSP0800 /ASSEMBLY_ACC=CAM_ASM_000638 /LENGTH=110 /DNA_ID=CAMNT_0006578913 /DNA_START=477 /DNA_END=809 /DNA_ORIENTATION=-